jgi:hypothetical protein
MRLLPPSSYRISNLHATKAAEFLRALEARGIYDLQFHPAPFEMEIEDFDALQRELRIVLGAVTQITRRVFRGSVDAHAQFLRLNALQRMFATFPQIHKRDLIARPDLICGKNGLKALELNIGSGIGYLPETYLYHLYATMNEPLSGLTILNPLPAFKSLLASRGDSVVYLDSAPVVADPVRAALNRLWIEDVTSGFTRLKRPSNACTVFLGFSTYQLEDRLVSGEATLLHLLRKHAHQLLCPPSSVLLESKLNLAILSDPAYGKFFSARQREAADRLIPWTRPVTLAVAEQVAKSPRKYVLKRAADRGGNSFVACGQCGPTELDARLKQALVDGDWLAQQKVEPAALKSSSISAQHELDRGNYAVIARAVFVGSRIVGTHCSTAIGGVDELVSAKGWSGLAIRRTNGASRLARNLRE